MKALILCGALIAFAAPAVANTIDGAVRPVAGLHGVFETTVPLGHLDLDDALGAKAALDRIKAAAGKVCGVRPSLMSVVATHNYRTCVSLAVDNAVADLDAPLVTARHGRGDAARLASR